MPNQAVFLTTANTSRACVLIIVIVAIGAIIVPSPLRHVQKLPLASPFSMPSQAPVSNSPPSVFLLAPFYYQACASLNGAANAEAGASIATIHWDWGDGMRTAGWFPQSHSYSSQGMFLVNVSATDTNGVVGFATSYVSISSSPTPLPPQISLSDPSTKSLTVSVNGIANFDACGPSPASPFNFNWGDGSSNLGYFPQTHTYDSSGTRSVCVTATDSLGLFSKQCTSVSTGSPSFNDTEPAVANGTIDEQRNNIGLWPGGKIYIYGYATGGGSQSANFANGQYTSVENHAGYTVAEISISDKPSNNFETSAAYYVIGGIAISTSSYNSSFSTSNSLATTGAADYFSVQKPHSLVVVVALAGGEQCIDVSGLQGLKIDASSPTSTGNLGLVIAHTYLDGGNYSVSESTSQCAAAQDPSHAGDLIGAFVFSSGSVTQNTPTGPNSDIPFVYLVGGAGVVVAGGISIFSFSRIRQFRNRNGKPGIGRSQTKLDTELSPNVCPKCGAELPDMAVFCGKCRTRIKP